MAARRRRLPWHRRHRRRRREHWRQYGVVLRRLCQRPRELGAAQIAGARRLAFGRAVGVAVRSAVRVTHPADRAVPIRVRRERFAHLDHAVRDEIQIDRGPDGHLARVLMVAGELVPLEVHAPLVVRLGREVLALVVHRDVEIEDPLLHPPTPVLQHLAVGARHLPAALGRRTVAVRDRVSADRELRLDRIGLDVDLAHDVRDLIATPSEPLGVVWARVIDAASELLEARDGDRVVAPRRDSGECREVLVGQAHAVEVQSVDVVIGRDARVHAHHVVRGIGMARIEKVVGSGAIGPVVTARDPVVRARLRRPVHVEDVVRVERRRDAVPDGGGDDPGVHLDALGVRLGDERVERVVWEWCDAGLRARHHCAVAEAVAAASDLHDECVEVRGLRGRDELRNLHLVEDAFAECVHPERAELALRRARLRRAGLKEDGEDEQECESTTHHVPPVAVRGWWRCAFEDAISRALA